MWKFIVQNKDIVEKKLYMKAKRKKQKKICIWKLFTQLYCDAIYAVGMLFSQEEQGPICITE